MIQSVPCEVVLAILEFIFKIENPNLVTLVEMDYSRVTIEEMITDDVGNVVITSDGDFASRKTVIPITRM